MATLGLIAIGTVGGLVFLAISVLLSIVLLFLFVTLCSMAADTVERLIAGGNRELVRPRRRRLSA